MPAEKIDMRFIDMNQYSRCGKYLIEKFCRESLPCSHEVINTETQMKFFLSAPEIQKLFGTEKIKNPHFTEWRTVKKYSETCPPPPEAPVVKKSVSWWCC